MTYNLTLSAEHLTVISNALQEMPMRLALPVVLEINKQIQSADAALTGADESKAT